VIWLVLVIFAAVLGFFIGWNESARAHRGAVKLLKDELRRVYLEKSLERSASMAAVLRAYQHTREPLDPVG
jgi:hypothetical protein